MDPVAYIIIPIWLAGLISIPLFITIGVFLTLHFDKKSLEKEGAVELPNHKGTMVVNSDAFPLEVQSRVLTRFIEEFNQRFPVKRNWFHNLFGLKDLNKAKKRLIIEWTDGDWFWSRNKNNKTYPGNHKWRGKVRGQFIGNKRVVTAARNNVEPALPIGSTAFIHELTHWALGVTTGDSDADHAQGEAHGNSWTGKHNAFIEELNAEFR